MAKSTSGQLPMFDPTTCEDSRSVTSSPGLVDGASRCDSPDGLTIGTFGPAPALVSLSRAPAPKLAGTIRATFGLSGFELVKECRPVVVFGEQVEAAIGHGWLDRLCDDMESENYAVGAVGLPGPCVGAFDIRQRLWFVADADGLRRGRWRITDRFRSEGSWGAEAPERGRVFQPIKTRSSASAVADARQEQRRPREGARPDGNASTQRNQEAADDQRCSLVGFWDAVDWLPCSDGKARPVEPGTFPLAYGVSARVGRLRGYGNAIKPQVAQAFIEAYMSVAATD